MKYEVFYSEGGHGGPFSSMREAMEYGKRWLRGMPDRSMHVKVVRLSDWAEVAKVGKDVLHWSKSGAVHEKEYSEVYFKEVE